MIALAVSAALAVFLGGPGALQDAHDVASVELRGIPMRGWEPPTAEVLFYRLDADMPQRIETRRVAPDGTLPIRWAARGETEDIDRFVAVRIRHADGAVALIDEATGLARVPVRKLERATMRPVVPLVRLCQVDEEGAPIRSWKVGTLQYGSRDRRRTSFLITEPRFAAAGWFWTCREYLRLRFRADQFAIDEDGVVRVRPRVLYDAGGVIEVRSDRGLPPGVALSVEVKSHGRFVSTFNSGISIERAGDAGFHLSNLRPGTYRLSLRLEGNASGGSVLLGDVDVEQDGAAQVRVPEPLPLHEFTLDVTLPSDPRRRRRHWKLCFDQRDERGWMTFTRLRNEVRWLGDRPSTALLGLQAGPRLPGEYPLRWVSEDHAEVDASAAVLNRALVDASGFAPGRVGCTGGTPSRMLDAELASSTALRSAGGGGVEVLWWAGTHPRVPLIVTPSEDPAMSLYADDDLAAASRLAAWIEPEAGPDRAPAPMALRPVDVRLTSVQPRTLRVFAWLGEGEVPAVALRAPRVEMLRPCPLLEVAALSLPEAGAFTFPSERCTMIVHDVDRASSAVVPRTALRAGEPLVLDLDALEWSAVPTVR